MLLVQMASQQLVDPITSQPIDGSAMFADVDRADIPYVFSPDGSQAARSPANRIVLDRKYGSNARSVLEAHLDNTSALDTHGIDAEARTALRNKNLTNFISAREKEIKRQENAFLKTFSLTISDSIEQSKEEIDDEES